MPDQTKLDCGTAYYVCNDDGTLSPVQYLGETVIVTDDDYTSEYSTFFLEDGTRILVCIGEM